MPTKDEYRTIEDQLIKAQRDARRAILARRSELAVAGVEREIQVWQEIGAVIAKPQPDFEGLIDLLVQAHTLEQAKKHNFYL